MYRKVIKAVSVILSVTMLMGITVFADTITDLQNQKNQKEKEIDNIEDELAYVMLQMDELEISMAEKNADDKKALAYKYIAAHETLIDHLSDYMASYETVSEQLEEIKDE